MTVAAALRSTLLPGWFPTALQKPMGKPKFDALSATAAQLQSLLIKGSLTSVDVVEEYISRINQYNGYLKAVYIVAPDALERAKALDAKRAAGEFLGPLHGIPVLLKDNIATHPSLGMDTTAGAWAMVGAEPAANAPLVDRLISAGAILLGKASMSELAFQKGNGLPCGWSAVVGQAQSAYVRGGVDPSDSIGGHSNPGGSSSGSAISVSAGFTTLAVGTETEGSLIQPAMRAALYCIKPTWGIISGSGILPVSYAYDTPGPMAKSARDVADLLTALVDPSKTTVPKGGYASALSGGWDNLKIGSLDPEIWRYSDFFTKDRPEATEQITRDTLDAYKKLSQLAKAYHHFVDLRPKTDFVLDGSNALIKLFFADFRPDLEDYLQGLNKSHVRTLKELIEWNTAHKDLALPEGYSSQATLETCQDLNLSEADRKMYYDHTQKVGASIDETLKKYDIDVIIGPGDCWLTQLAASKRYPVVSLPLTTLTYNGRPIGLSACAPAHKEAVLVQLMAAWEASFGPRPQPVEYAGNQRAHAEL